MLLYKSLQKSSLHVQQPSYARREVTCGVAVPSWCWRPRVWWARGLCKSAVRAQGREGAVVPFLGWQALRWVSCRCSGAEGMSPPGCAPRTRSWEVRCWAQAVQEADTAHRERAGKAWGWEDPRRLGRGGPRQAKLREEMGWGECSSGRCST